MVSMPVYEDVGDLETCLSIKETCITKQRGDFPYLSVNIFPGLSYRQMCRKFLVLGLLVHVMPSNFFRKILRSVALVYKSYIFFQNSRSKEIIQH